MMMMMMMMQGMELGCCCDHLARFGREVEQSRIYGVSNCIVG